MILPDWMIRLHQEFFNLLEPYDPKLVQPNGYDLRLGNVVFELMPQEEPVSVKRGKLYQKHQAIVISEEEGYILKPKSFALFTTLEYVRIPRHLVAVVWNRSSLARLGVRVRGDAGFIDSGFEGVIALEVYNDSDQPYIFYHKDKIAQIVFHLTIPPLKPYQGVYKKQNKWEVTSWGV